MKIVIRFVDPASPAVPTPIRVGDVLRSIDRTPVGTAPLATLGRASRHRPLSSAVHASDAFGPCAWFALLGS